MKKKYLKKMLAIMLASMTVAATPGLVGAIKKESKDAIQAVNEQIANQSLKEEDAISKLDELEKIANEDDDAKKEVAETLAKMIDEGVFVKKSTKRFNRRRMPQQERHRYFQMAHQEEEPSRKTPSEKTISKIIEIFQKCLNCDGAKRNAAKSIENMAKKGWLVPYVTSFSFGYGRTFLYVIKFLNNCLDYSDKTNSNDYSETKQHAAKAIDYILKDMIKHEDNLGFVKIDPESVPQIEILLAKCLEDNEKTVASAIASLAGSCDFEVVLKEYCDRDDILNMLEKILKKDDGAKKYIAQSVAEFVQYKTFKKDFPRERILNILQSCLESTDAQKYIAKTIGCCPDDQPPVFDSNSLDQCLYMLEVCSKNCDAREEVASAIYGIPFKDLLDRNSCDKILNILSECSEQPKARDLIIDSIKLMTKQDLLDATSVNASLMRIIELCSTNSEAMGMIKFMVDKGVFDQCQSNECEQISKSIASLIKENRHSIEVNLYTKSDFCNAIKTMVDKNILVDYINPVVMQLTRINNIDTINTSEFMNAVEAMNDKDLLNKCDSYHINLLLSSVIDRLGDAYFGNRAANFILKMDEKDLLKKCEPYCLGNVVSSLINNLDNNNARDLSMKTIAVIIKNHNVLKQLNDAQIQKLIDSLPDALGNNNTQEAATIILSAMAERDMLNEFNDDQIQQILNLFRDQLEIYLAAGNYEMVDKIFKVLKACSEMDDLKENVANIAYNLVTNSDFYPYLNQNVSKPRLRNILEVSMSCSKTQDDETRAKALFAIADVIHNVGSTVALTEIAADQIEQKIPQIIEILEESSMVDDAKFHVSDIINLLGRRGFFQNLTHGQSRRLIQALDNCLTYGGERITTAGNLNEAQQNIATHVCSIFNGDTSWLIAFRAGLLPDDEASFNQLQNDAWAAEGNAYANM